jgi:hypothetical protein
LGWYLASLANFVSIPIRPKRVKAGGSRERPSDSQLQGPDANGSEPWVMHRGGLFAGAACCDLLGFDSTLKQTSRRRQTHDKAVPLQSNARPQPLLAPRFWLLAPTLITDPLITDYAHTGVPSTLTAVPANIEGPTTRSSTDKAKRRLGA